MCTWLGGQKVRERELQRERDCWDTMSLLIVFLPGIQDFFPDFFGHHSVATLFWGFQMISGLGGRCQPVCEQQQHPCGQPLLYCSATLWQSLVHGVTSLMLFSRMILRVSLTPCVVLFTALWGLTWLKLILETMSTEQLEAEQLILAQGLLCKGFGRLLDYIFPINGIQIYPVYCWAMCQPVLQPQ